MMILKNMGKKKEKLNNKNTPEREKNGYLSDGNRELKYDAI